MFGVEEEELYREIADLKATLARVNQTKIGEFIVYHPVLQPDEKTMVDLYVGMEKEIAELKRKLEVAKKALGKYANEQTHSMDESGFLWSGDYFDYETAKAALKELEK